MHARTPPASSPRFIVAVPVFKHPVLVADALRSLLAQQLAGQMHVIVVDDGCPLPETQTVLRAFAASHPDAIQCVRQENRGLSGARNTAIEIALAHYPGAEGIYFLDSDNLLKPWALDRVGEALRDHPEAAWFFPDIVTVGVRSLYSHEGVYDLFEHLGHNYCEAGSFVRMKVFAAGLRFDENMKLGYEDWEFWLQAAAAGFHGQYLPDSGFRYRKRGESMLAESDRDRTAILSYIRTKHRKNFSRQAMLELEASDRPRLAFVDLDTCQVHLGLSPLDARAKEISLEEFAARLADERSGLPNVAIFGTRQLFSFLARHRLAEWAIWELENSSHHHIKMIKVSAGADPVEITVSSAPFSPASGSIFAIDLSLLRVMARNPRSIWIKSLGGPSPEPQLDYLSITLPEILPPSLRAGARLSDLFSLIEELGDLFAEFGDNSPWDTATAGRASALPSQVYLEWHGIKNPFPRARLRKNIEIGFILPVVTFGGVERVAHQTAKALRASGYVPHLILVGGESLTLPDEVRDTYETIRIYRPSAGDKSWHPDRDYYGTNLGLMPHERILLLAGLCADLDMVINAHSIEAHSAAGILRRAGVITAMAQHVFDHSEVGRPLGHPILGLAYEHGYDLVTAISQQMADQLHGLGIPREKLLVLPNAPGFSVDDAQVSRVLAERKARRGPLRCLFMGRLDFQKGLDRLEVIIGLSRQRELTLKWRVIGKAVVDSYRGDSVADIAIEPAVYSGADISERLSWADVVVMPSRNEGLPLLAIEAMRYGCVVIATDVGALDELVQSGNTGFLVESELAIPQIVALLEELSRDRPRCLKIGQAAAEAARPRNWNETVKPLDAWIRKRREATMPAV